MRDQYKVLSERYEQIQESEISRRELVLLFYVSSDPTKEYRLQPMGWKEKLPNDPYDLEVEIEPAGNMWAGPYSMLVRITGYDTDKVLAKAKELADKYLAKEPNNYKVFINIIKKLGKKTHAKVVWEGTCNNACKGAWFDVNESSLNEIKDLLYQDAEPEWQVGVQDLEIAGQPFTQPLYFPESFTKFKKILDSNNIVRFFNGEWFYVYGYDKQTVHREINETLNRFCDLGGADF